MGQSTPDGLDCFECKVTGTLGSFAIGSYLWYNSSRGRYATRPTQKWGLRLISLLPFYISAARWFYFPPFTSLKGRTLDELIQDAEKRRIAASTDSKKTGS
ncbi:hypothetical protein AAVH_24436 [Aphelenchoides avenae]|nr:hypothetical protein AAVH_24436 [Aphelenchus avenae]